MILLDTHVLIWWANQSSQLSDTAKGLIENTPVKLVAAISVWEIAMLVQKQRLNFDRDVEIWVKQALQLPGIQLTGLSPSVSIRSTRLPGEFHGDPADRIVVATALEYGIPLVTKDRNVRSYKGVKTVW